MTGERRATIALEPHRVRTRNLSIASDNRIHDDALAARYGFAGGLVAGTLVYAHMTTPLVRVLGPRWLEHSVAELRLLKPAYDGQRLTVTAMALPGAEEEAGYSVGIANEQGTRLATLETRSPATLPAVSALAEREAADPATPVVPIGPETLRVDEPLRALAWTPTAEENARWCEAAGDPLPLYEGRAGAPVHPGRVLQAANDVFRHHFRLNPWIHVSSRIVHRAPLRVGEAVEVRAVPTARWERRGHEFVTLYVALLRAGAPAVEVEHTAIYKVRPAK